MLKPQITYRTPAILGNGNFEQGGGGWAGDSDSGGQGWNIVQGQPTVGGLWAAVFFTNAAPTTQQLSIRSLTIMSVTVGDTVTGSAYIFTNAAQPVGPYCAVRLNFLDVNGNTLLTSTGPHITGAQAYTLSTVVGTAPANAVRVTLDITATTGFVGSILVDNASVTGAYNNQTLTFVYPPTSKPIQNKQATRTDTYSTAGVRQTVVQRVNEVFPIQMKNILAGDDATAWQAFLDFAVDGSPFEFYPDETNQLEHFTMFLSDTSSQLVFSSAGIYTFSGNLQKEITA